MVFIAYYSDMGDLQKVGEKAGLINKLAEVTKEKNGLVFFKVENEEGERKIKQTEINKIRDFGTSLYGLFDTKLSDKEALELISKRLAERISETNNILTKVLQEVNNVKY